VDENRDIRCFAICARISADVSFVSPGASFTAIRVMLLLFEFVCPVGPPWPFRR